MKKLASLSIVILLFLFLLGMALLYWKQEKLIFFPEKIEVNQEFQFSHSVGFEEVWVPVSESDSLHGLLFRNQKSENSLVFYIHGNGESVARYGELAPFYASKGFDFFVWDYRGFGKSSGSIGSEEQFYEDVEKAFQKIVRDYPLENVVIVGYSIGTASAAYLASKNAVKHLVLQAPYYDIEDIKARKIAIIPDFMLRYHFSTFSFVSKNAVPLTIFHGNEDKLVSPLSSELLEQHFKKEDQRIVLDGLGHMGFEQAENYQKFWAKLLSQ